MQRRAFIKNTGAVALATGIVGPGFVSYGSSTKLTVFHTNDLHNCFNRNTHAWVPKPGALNSLYEQISQAKLQFPESILLDAGDFCDSNPGSGAMIAQMSELGYDAVTLGAQELAMAPPTLSQMLHKATFSVLACNEIGTNLDLKAKPYQVFQRGSLKIGVLGIGASSTPLLHSAELDILNQANHFAHHLRQVERVDYVVALSHLGYWHTDGRISDLDLARQSENIDLIIGGQSHTFMEEPIFLNNKKGRSIAIKHAGCDGALLGQIDIQFFSDGRAPELNCKNNVLSMA